MHVEILRTEMATDHIYLDLMKIDETLYTFVMEKIQDPNIYGIKEQIDGEDKFDELLEKYPNCY